MNPIETLLNTSRVDFYFLVVDEFLDINLYPQLKNFCLIYAYNNKNLAGLKAKGVLYFCLEEEGVTLPAKNSGQLLQSDKVIGFIKRNSAATGNRPAIIPFKPSAKIELICHNNNWLLIANPSSINRLLEDKVKFYQLASASNLPLIPSQITQLNQDIFRKLQGEWGRELVIQSHFGWAGNSTYKFIDWKQVPQNLIGITVKISPYIKGYSLLNNCCQTKEGLIQSPPGLQYTGLTQYTSNPFATVGRQWPSRAPQHVLSQIQQITQDFSQKILLPLNYKGFFGLDFLVSSDKKVYILECNPRLTASFAFYTYIEQKANLTPLFYYHLLEFSKIPYTINLSEEQSRFSNINIVGSEITLKNQTSQTIAKYHDFIEFSQSPDPVTFSPEIQMILNKYLS